MFWAIIERWKDGYFALIAVAVIFLAVTGIFWIYSEPISKSWDCALGHISYYELRRECLEYIDAEKLNYDEIGSSFGFYGRRSHYELQNPNKIVQNDMNHLIL